MLWKVAISPISLRIMSPQQNILRTINIKPLVKNVCSKFSPLAKGDLEILASSSLKYGALGITAWSMKFILLKPASCESVIQPKHIEKKPSFDWKKCLRLLSVDLWALLTAICAALVVAYLNIQIPLYLGSVINVMSDVIKQSNFSSLLDQMKSTSLQLINLYLGQAIATFMYISLLAKVGEGMATRLRYELFESLMKQDISFFDEKRTGELLDCLTTDVQEFKSAFKQCISQGLRSITQIAGCIISLFVISPTMTTTMILVVPSVIIAGTMIGSLLRGISRKSQEQAIIVTTQAEEVISNIRTVRAFANERRECNQFKEELDEASNLNIKLGVGIGIFQAGTNLFLNGLVLGTLYLGAHLMMTENLSAGNLMSFLVATQTIQRSLAQLSLLLGHFVKGKQAGARVFEFINLEPTMPLSGGEKIEYHSLIPRVEFKDVTFSYPTRPGQVILQKLNLLLPPGKTVAIVGTSGNGKSTIAALLERLYDPDNGCIELGGEDLRKLDPSWLRGTVIGIINQEPVLFATTVKENIRYGKPDATDEEVLSAAELANADEFIRGFPMGYETVLGERGVTVSGGQKQRIAIARALIKNPSILILDEATSALDPESEKVVQKTLEKICKGRTVLVIAHRLSTIQDADLIVVLKKGVIVEKGTHKSLTALKGVYYTLMNQQSMDAERKLG